MLTDEKLETMLRGAFADEADHLTSPPGLSSTIRRRHAIARRRLAFAATAPVVGAAVAVAAMLSATPPPGETKIDVNRDPSRIQLAGYTFTLPERYGAREGSCELTLPDGTTRTGVPGAHDSCLVLMEESFVPSWSTEDPPPGVGDWIGVAVTEGDAEFVQLTVFSRDPATGRYLVLSLQQPRTETVVLQVADLRKILEEGLAAGRDAPSGDATN